MTEAEWLAGHDPDTLLNFLGGGASNRRLRLFACACCRRIWGLLTSPRYRGAVETSERYADRLAGPQELKAARAAAWERLAEQEGSDAPARAAAVRGLLRESRAAAFEARAVVANRACRRHEDLAAASQAWHAAEAAEKRAQCALLRDIFGNPFRPAQADPAWLAWDGGTVAKLAHAIYDGRRFSELPYLGDALEEAGCADETVLAHCRGPGPHVRGCWVLDLLLGQE
jgi:hypothetical protein